MERRKLGKSDLFDLVKSMTKAEKIYFHQYAGRGNNSYIQLFLALQKQKKYDKESLLESTGISLNQFRNQKKYLHHLLLKSLESYHAETSIDSRLRRAFLQIEILVNKGLAAQAMVTLQNAKLIAQKYQRHIILLELLQWEKQILNTHSYSHTTLDDLDAFEQNEKQLLVSINRELKSWGLSMRTYLIGTKSGIRNTSFTKDMEQLRQSIQQGHHESADSLMSQIHLYAALCNYYSSKGDWEQLYAHRLATIKLFDKNPDFIEGNINKYIVALYNLLVAYFNLEQFGKEFEQTLRKMKDVPADYLRGQIVPDEVETRIFTFASSIRLAMLIRVGEIKKALRFVQKILPELASHESRMNQYMKLNLHYNISLTYFSNNLLDESQLWINKIINETESYTGDQFYIFARMFNLIINYERGNFFLFEYMARSTKRYIRKREHEFEYEKALVGFFKKINKKNILKRNFEKEEFMKLKKIFEQIQKNPHEKKAMSYFDFMAWFNSKITGAPYINLILHSTHKFQTFTGNHKRLK